MFKNPLDKIEYALLSGQSFIMQRPKAVMVSSSGHSGIAAAADHYPGIPLSARMDAEDESP